MKYVYILTSINTPERHYTGITDNLETRLAKHNAGEIIHTNKFKPWKIETIIQFSNPEKAIQFEKYLKSGSGRAFAKKRF